MTSALRATNGYLEGRLLLLPPDRTFSIGSSLENEMILFGDEVGKVHCRITPSPDGNHSLKTVRDNIVYFRKSPVQRLELADGDPIAIGEHDFIYHQDADLLIAEETYDIDRRLLLKRNIGQFRILRKVQMSEMAITYMAIDPDTDKKVALRLFKAEHMSNPKMTTRFLTRAMVGMTLNSPKFQEIQSINSSHGTCFLVTELLDDSVKFERFLRDRTPMDPYEAAAFIKQFAKILKFARERRILIGRRKPSGLYIYKDNRIKVCDFDLSKSLEDNLVSTAAFQDFFNSKFRPPEDTDSFGENHQKIDRTSREPKNIQEVADESIDIMMAGRILFHLLSGKSFNTKASPQIIIDGYGRPSGKGDKKVIRTGPLQDQPRDLLMCLARMVTGDASKRLKNLDDVDVLLTRVLTNSEEE